MSKEKEQWGELELRDGSAKKKVNCVSVGLTKNLDKPGEVYLLIEGEAEYILFSDPLSLMEKIRDMVQVARQAGMTFGLEKGRS